MKVMEVDGVVTLFGRTLLDKNGTWTQDGICVWTGLASAIFCTLSYKLSKYYTPWYFKGYKKLSHNDQRDWDTRPANIVYSAFIVWLAWSCLVTDGLLYDTSRVPSMLRISDKTCAGMGVSLGFFIVEFIVTLKYGMGGAPMILHHVGSLASVGAAAYIGDGHVYTLWMLSTEATTPFIAFRFMLDKAGLRSSNWYVVNGLSILLSWMVFRLATFPPFFWFVWHRQHELTLINPFSQFLLIVFPVVLFTLNIFWFSKIVHGAAKLFVKPKTN